MSVGGQVSDGMSSGELEFVSLSREQTRPTPTYSTSHLHRPRATAIDSLLTHLGLRCDVVLSTVAVLVGGG